MDRPLILAILILVYLAELPDIRAAVQFNERLDQEDSLGPSATPPSTTSIIVPTLAILGVMLVGLGALAVFYVMGCLWFNQDKSCVARNSKQTGIQDGENLSSAGEGSGVSGSGENKQQKKLRTGGEIEHKLKLTDTGGYVEYAQVNKEKKPPVVPRKSMLEAHLERLSQHDNRLITQAAEHHSSVGDRSEHESAGNKLEAKATTEPEPNTQALNPPAARHPAAKSQAVNPSAPKSPAANPLAPKLPAPKPSAQFVVNQEEPEVEPQLPQPSVSKIKPRRRRQSKSERLARIVSMRSVTSQNVRTRRRRSTTYASAPPASHPADPLAQDELSAYIPQTQPDIAYLHPQALEASYHQGYHPHVSQQQQSYHQSQQSYHQPQQQQSYHQPQQQQSYHHSQQSYQQPQQWPAASYPPAPYAQQQAYGLAAPPFHSYSQQAQQPWTAVPQGSINSVYP